MSKGWKEHRLEANGEWQFTGQMTDQLRDESAAIPVGRSLFDGVDTLGQPVRVWTLPTEADPLPVGTLGWVQFSTPPERILPPDLPRSDYQPPARKDY